MSFQAYSVSVYIKFKVTLILCSAVSQVIIGGCLAHGVASGLGPTPEGLPEATVECEVLLRGHSGHQAAGFDRIELPAIGNAQSPYGSCHATFPAPASA